MPDNGYAYQCNVLATHSSLEADEVVQISIAGISMDFWQTSKKPNYRRAAVNVVLLLIAGAMLFFMAALLLAPFSRLAAALSRISLLDWEAWLLALAVALPAGLAWTFFFVVFEAVKEVNRPGFRGGCLV